MTQKLAGSFTFTDIIPMSQSDVFEKQNAHFLRWLSEIDKNNGYLIITVILTWKKTINAKERKDTV